MSFLKSLTFTDINDKKPSPVIRKRLRVLSNLRDQLIRWEDPTFCKSRMKWVKTDEGKKLIEQKIAVRPWWRETIDVQYSFFIKTGLKKVEFEQGKAAILVSKLEEIPILINGLMEAIQKGELDHLFQDKDSRQQIPTSRKRAA